MFIKFSGKVTHETRNNLEHFQVVAVKLFDPGLIFLFSGFVFASNIMVNSERIFMEFS